MGISTTETFVPLMAHGEATPNSIAATLQGAIELLGPNGERWTTDELRGDNGTYCLVGAIEQAAPNYESYAAARDALKETIGSGNIDRFNNRATFPDVKSAVDRTLINMGAAPSPVYIPPAPVIPPGPVLPPPLKF